MQSYRGIVIGCGKIGVLNEADEKRPRPRSHAGALAAHPRAELAAFVGRDQAECAAALKYFPETPCFTDVGGALKAVQPDIVIIAASTPVHAEIAIACAEARVPIVIGEKPIASAMSEALMMQEALRRAGTVFALNYQRRYFPLFAQARMRILGGELGRILSVECRYDNGLYNNGGHAIDTLMYLFDDVVSSVSGTIDEQNLTHPEGDSNIEGKVTTQKGAVIALRSFDQTITPIHDLYIHGERGDLAITKYGYHFAWQIGAERHEETGEISMTSGVLEDAIRAYEEKRAPGSSFANGISTLAVLETLRTSAEHGGVEKEVGVYS